VNADHIAPIPWRQEDEDLFRSLIETHQTETGSATALAAFQPFVPIAVASGAGLIPKVSFRALTILGLVFREGVRGCSQSPPGRGLRRPPLPSPNPDHRGKVRTS
jgi:hypothetical protein